MNQLFTPGRGPSFAFAAGRGLKRAFGLRNSLRTPKRTRTMTMTKREPLRQKAKESRGGSESAYSKSVVPRGVPSLIAKLAKNVYITNNNSVIDGGAGLQTVSDVQGISDYAALNAIMLSALAQYLPGGSPPMTAYKTERVMITKVFAEHMYTNSSNAVVRGLLFDVEPRQDIYNSGSDPISPAQAWIAGAADQSNGNTSSSFVGALPFSSNKFTHFFKINKITELILAPGQTHYHRVTYRCNKVLTNIILQEGNVNYFRGLSMNQLAVFYGQPVPDSTGAAVTTEAVHILTVSKFQYESSYMMNNVSTISRGNALSATAGANLEDIVTGAAAAFAKV